MSRKKREPGTDVSSWKLGGPDAKKGPRATVKNNNSPVPRLDRLEARNRWVSIGLVNGNTSPESKRPIVGFIAMYNLFDFRSLRCGRKVVSTPFTLLDMKPRRGGAHI